MSREYDLIHEAVRLNPESVWEQVRRFLCARALIGQDVSERLDLIEDLMFWHSDEFIDRLERLVEECPWIAEIVVDAHVGGRAETNGLTRFYQLQERLAT